MYTEKQADYSMFVTDFTIKRLKNKIKNSVQCVNYQLPFGNTQLAQWLNVLEWVLKVRIPAKVANVQISSNLFCMNTKH